METTGSHIQVKAPALLSLAEKAALGYDVESFQNRMMLRIKKASRMNHADERDIESENVPLRREENSRS